MVTDSPEEEPVDVETFDSVIAALSVRVRPGAPAANNYSEEQGT